MKRMILALVAIMTMTAAMAQGDNQQGRRERRQFDRTEMIKNRTDDAVKKYGLNEEQAAKLLELNTKYADTPRPNFGGGDGQGAQQGQRPEMTEEMKAQMEKMRKEREEATKKYEAELQTIMTEDQFKAYKADQEKRQREGGRRMGGRRN